MAVAIALDLDPSAVAIVDWLAGTLEHGAGLPSYRQTGLAPHMALAIYETLDIAAAAPRLERWAAGQRPPAVRLGSLGVFGGPAGTLFLAPIVGPELLALHESFQAEFADLMPQRWPFYQTGNWIPHVTLAQDLDGLSLAGAVEALAPGFAPIDAQLPALRVIGYDPLETLHVSMLGAGIF
jgi:2'-5' RNA ligase